MTHIAHRLRPAAGEPEGALVLLHGRGADEHDLFPMLDELDPGRRLTGVTGRAPLSLGGAPGQHWYAVRRVGFPDHDTFHATMAELGPWLDGLEEETGVPPARTVVGGFSQGAVMSYAVGLGAGRPSPAGLVTFSGFLPTVAGFELDLADRPGLPVAISHGTFDGVIGVDFGHQARDVLSAAGLAVDWAEAPIPHAIDPSRVVELRGWLAAAVASPG